jgi:hypothetical protein
MLSLFLKLMGFAMGREPPPCRNSRVFVFSVLFNPLKMLGNDVYFLCRCNEQRVSFFVVGAVP